MRVATQRSVHTSQAQIKHQRHKGYDEIQNKSKQ